VPNTPEHKATMYALGQQRRKAGLPSWKHTLDLRDVFHSDVLSFEDRRDIIVGRIRASSWFKEYREYDDLQMAVEELADTDEVEWFDAVWDAIYDIADADRMWISTI